MTRNDKGRPLPSPKENADDPDKSGAYMSAQEEWRPIPGYTDYEVSDLGRILSRKKHRGTELRLLRPSAHPHGYPQVQLTGPAGVKNRSVHSLIAEAFIGPRPEGQQVRHLDGDATHCHLHNIQYGTGSENAADMVRHGTHRNVRKTHCPKQHPYSDENTDWQQGKRRCRECHRIRERARHHRKALAAANVQLLEVSA